MVMKKRKNSTYIKASKTYAFTNYNAILSIRITGF
jgi:hypothetical protein